MYGPRAQAKWLSGSARRGSERPQACTSPGGEAAGSRQDSTGKVVAEIDETQSYLSASARLETQSE